MEVNKEDLIKYIKERIQYCKTREDHFANKSNRDQYDDVGMHYASGKGMGYWEVLCYIEDGVKVTK